MQGLPRRGTSAPCSSPHSLTPLFWVIREAYAGISSLVACTQPSANAAPSARDPAVAKPLSSPLRDPRLAERIVSRQGRSRAYVA